LPADPTAALPGSVEKIAVLTDRENRSESLFHPQDANHDRDRPPPKWRVLLAGVKLVDGLVFAPTKSEARSIVKRRLGLSSLPAGTILELVAEGGAMTAIAAGQVNGPGAARGYNAEKFAGSNGAARAASSGGISPPSFSGQDLDERPSAF
jgi:hypothetical protein